VARGALAAILVAAAALRLLALNRVPPDPFYDAAVRTMGGSWHALLVGALEPGARVSIDKPPPGLWLQTASTQLLGLGRVPLQLPVALAGVAAVALLYDVVRRVAGRAAGLAAALVLAVLPISVMTARSDTMDTVMMALLVGAAWLAVRSRQTGRPWLLYAAAAAAGLAFEVKLFQSLVALPALVAVVTVRRVAMRRQLAVAAATFAAVALAWLVTMSLLPASQRPFAIGSSNGSAWNAAFVYNGVGRLGPRALGGSGRRAGAESSQPGVARLVARRPAPTAALIGIPAAGAVAFGGLALVAARRARGRPRADGRDAATLALAVWLVTGLVVSSGMARLHLRYLEGFTPAVAAALGVGVVACARAAAHGRWSAVGHATAAMTLGALGAWAAGPDRLLAAAVLAATAVAVALVQVVRRRPATWPVLAAATLAAVLIVPVARSVRIVRTGANDAGQAGLMPRAQAERLSRYLIAHQGGARDEVAVTSPFAAAGIVARDGRPVMFLLNTDGRALATPAGLAAAARAGHVRFALVDPGCTRPSRRDTAACAPARWARAHGTDVSAAAGLPPGRLHSHLYRLAPAAGR
jgi:4-amino-4-deoxy-L-arabinose transferase-like glycosyltransferase